MARTSILDLISEKAFQDEQLIPMLQRLGYFPWHDLDSRKNEAGFPDVWAISPARGLIVVEAKSETGRLMRCQECWITLLRRHAQLAFVIRPSQLDDLANLLQRDEPKTLGALKLYETGGYVRRLTEEELLLGPHNVALKYHEIVTAGERRARRGSR